MSHYLPEFTPQASASAPGAGGERDAPIAQAPSAPSVYEPYTSSFYAAAPAAPSEPAKRDFGDSTNGWKGSNAALTLVRGIKGKAIRVTRSNDRETFAFYAAKRPVSKKAGEPYRARAYVRTTSPGMYLCLRVQEYGGGVPTTTERCAPARLGWRRVALKVKTAGKGHRLVVSIHVMAALGGTSFDVDGFRLS